MRELDRISQQPGVMGGKARIHGMRVTVGMIVGQIGAGQSIDDILADYPYLEQQDILQALRYRRVFYNRGRQKWPGPGTAVPSWPDPPGKKAAQRDISVKHDSQTPIIRG